MPLPHPRVLICERGDAVVLAVRRALAGLDVRTVRTVTADDARAELARVPRSVVTVEVAERSLAATLELIDAARRVRECRLVAVLPRGMERFEPLLRELGAVHVVVSARDLSCVREIVERHLLEPLRQASREVPFADTFGQPERMFAEAMSRLPWAN